MPTSYLDQNEDEEDGDGINDGEHNDNTAVNDDDDDEKHSQHEPDDDGQHITVDLNTDNVDPSPDETN